MIEFRDVSMTYKPGINALRKVSFKILDSEFVFVIGKSGSGKSTLIKLLTCEENPTAGSVFIDDYEISFLSRSLIPYLRRNIGMVFQDFRLIYSKTVYENVAFAMEIIGASKKNIRTRVPIVLSIVGLRNKANMKPNQLSGGEQQRVAIARAMVNNPMLILADEPTGNLDPLSSELIMALLEEINCTGTTIVVCTHDSSIVNKMKRRVIEIADGRIVRDDKLGEYILNTSPIIRPSKNSPKETNKDYNKANKADTDKKLKTAPFVRNINIKLDNEEDFQKFILENSHTVFPDNSGEEDTFIEKVQYPNVVLEENVENVNEPHKKPVVEDSVEVLKKVYDYYSIKASEYMAKGKKKEKDKKSSGKSDKNDWEMDFEKTIIPERVDQKEDRE